jgi:hypothetical protein
MVNRLRPPLRRLPSELEVIDADRAELRFGAFCGSPIFGDTSAPDSIWVRQNSKGSFDLDQ